MSGFSARTASSDASSARPSNWLTPNATGSAPERARQRRRRAPPPCRGLAGKSSAIHRAALHRQQPAAPGLERERLATAAAAPLSQSQCALASVACPHSATSAPGVNQRRRNPSSSGTRNAVSERFISRATCCIHAVVRGMVEQADGGGVAGERPVGERVHDHDGLAHGREYCRGARAAATFRA